MPLLRHRALLPAAPQLNREKQTFADVPTFLSSYLEKNKKKEEGGGGSICPSYSFFFLTLKKKSSE